MRNLNVIIVKQKYRKRMR